MSGTISDPHMPNGDCDCASLPVRHLDNNGHVPRCGNWTHDMLWQERLAHNIAMGASLCRAFDFGHRYSDDLWDVERIGRRWHPGCGKAAP